MQILTNTIQSVSKRCHFTYIRNERGHLCARVRNDCTHLHHHNVFLYIFLVAYGHLCIQNTINQNRTQNKLSDNEPGKEHRRQHFALTSSLKSSIFSRPRTKPTERQPIHIKNEPQHAQQGKAVMWVDAACRGLETHNAVRKKHNAYRYHPAPLATCLQMLQLQSVCSQYRWVIVTSTVYPVAHY